MTTIVGLCGSLREKSLNGAILSSAAQLAPQGSRIVIHSIRGIPLYDGDVEASQGVPAQVEALKDAIAASDGLLVATPEYNNSIPGVLKNAIDWLSRPDSDIKRVFGGKPVAMMGATPGAFGTTLSQSAWLPVWRTLGTQLWTERRMLVSRAHTLMDAEGAPTDEKTRDRLREFVRGFVEFAQRVAEKRR